VGCRDPERIRYAVLDARLAANLFLAKAQASGREFSITTRGYWETPSGRIPNVSYGNGFSESMGNRLFWKNGEGMMHYRLVYESPQFSLLFKRFDPDEHRADLSSMPLVTEDDWNRAKAIVENDLSRMEGRYVYDAVISPEVKIYEVVRGALVTGYSIPLDSVWIRLPLASETNDRTLEYSLSERADSTGRFHLRLPYPTIRLQSGPTVHATGPYEIYTSRYRDEPTWRLDLSEAVIRNGAVYELVDATHRP
jgi:hypothetical protein